MLLFRMIRTFRHIFQNNILRHYGSVKLFLLYGPRSNTMILRTSLPYAHDDRLTTHVLTRRVLRISRNGILTRGLSNLNRRFLTTIRVFRIRRISKIRRSLRIQTTSLIRRNTNTSNVMRSILSRQLGNGNRTMLLNTTRRQLRILSGNKGYNVTTTLQARFMLHIKHANLNTRRTTTRRTYGTSVDVMFFLGNIRNVHVQINGIRMITRRNGISTIFLGRVPRVRHVTKNRNTKNTKRLLRKFTRDRVNTNGTFLTRRQRRLFGKRLFHIVRARTRLSRKGPPPFPRGAQNYVSFVVRRDYIP